MKTKLTLMLLLILILPTIVLADEESNKEAIDKNKAEIERICKIADILDHLYRERINLNNELIQENTKTIIRLEQDITELEEQTDSLEASLNQTQMLIIALIITQLGLMIYYKKH